MKTATLLVLSLVTAQSLLGLTQHPIDEFRAGSVEKFSSRGYAKANGVVFTIFYPKSWSAMEGEGPDIVQKFVSDSGKGREEVIITTRKLPADTAITPQEIEELLSPAELKARLPGGATYIRAHRTKISNGPAGILEYSTGQKNTGSGTDIHTVACFFVQGGTLVELQFRIVGAPGYPSELRVQLFSPLWDAMIGRIELRAPE